MKKEVINLFGSTVMSWNLNDLHLIQLNISTNNTKIGISSSSSFSLLINTCLCICYTSRNMKHYNKQDPVTQNFKYKLKNYAIPSGGQKFRNGKE